ncbi:MAG: [FeFe] hydrogenase H-cluster maturation GTPase HydF [Clostridiales bacterium]|nr:[FeFe] hydrogenase H-cluster maturation GTPase HydF [Clostridiales bacterium]
MSLNSTPMGERVHIGFFGRRNAGKSSLVNAFTNQNLSIVSDVKGTTTDPVYKSMELLPLGPVTIIDTPGLDDEGELGKLRIKKCMEIVRKVDIAILVIDCGEGISDEDIVIYEMLKSRSIPTMLVMNKSDKYPDFKLFKHERIDIPAKNILYVSAINGVGIEELKNRVAESMPEEKEEAELIPSFIGEGDIVILVIPIDSSAPKGRLILPQQQVLRGLLDKGAIPVSCRDTELSSCIEKIGTAPRLVITDSQAFAKVNEVVAKRFPLTSFSILMAKYKGDYEWQLKGAAAIDDLKDGDKVLIAEGCTHHRQCEDIGTVKLPKWLKEFTGKDLVFEYCSGLEFKDEDELQDYKLVIHCGGCMLNAREMRYRVELCREKNVPVTNYGMAIAKMKGILDIIV